MQRQDSHRRIMVSVLATVGLLAAASANASLVGDKVNITLESLGDSISLTDTNVTVVDPGNEIQTGDSTFIGGSGTPLLPNEFLDIRSDRIILQLESGFEDPVSGKLSTGYAAGAYWEIGDLDFAGGSITGFDLFLTGISSLEKADIVFSNNNTFRIPISSLFITNSNTGFDVGQIELRLRTGGTPPPVPLPGALVLLSSGLCALVGVRRRRPR